MDRKAFNFYKSYYDVAIELPDEERNEFVWSIVSAQFTGEIIEPKGKLSRLMFLGQKHSILKQLEGFKAATKGPHEAPTEAPYQQVQGEGQGQEKGKEQVGKIKRFGKKSDNFFTIDSKYLTDYKYQIYEGGFNEFCENQNLKWFPKEYQVKLFWKDWDGKQFNDIKHLNTVMINIINNKNG